MCQLVCYLTSFVVRTIGWLSPSLLICIIDIILIIATTSCLENPHCLKNCIPKRNDEQMMTKAKVNSWLTFRYLERWMISNYVFFPNHRDSLLKKIYLSKICRSAWCSGLNNLSSRRSSGFEFWYRLGCLVHFVYGNGYSRICFTTSVGLSLSCCVLRCPFSRRK